MLLAPPTDATGAEDQAVMPLLAPLFQGEWAVHGRSLHCAPQPPADSLLLAELLRQPELLAGLLQRFARHLGVAGADLRAVASAWSRAYLSALLPPVVAAASLLQHRLEVRAEHIALRFKPHGEILSFHIPHEGLALPGSNTHARYETLLQAHLAPLFRALQQHSRLPLKILWGNTARHLEAIFEQAQLLAGPASGLAADRATLLESPSGSNARHNPLHQPWRRIVPLASGPATLHRQCCLYYLLPGEGYCGACPLDPRHRSVGRSPKARPCP